MFAWVKKGITKLGVLTLIAAAAVVMATVVFLLRLGDSLPNVMFSAVEPPLEVGADAHSVELRSNRAENASETAVQHGVVALRAFVQSIFRSFDTRQTGFAAYFSMLAPTAPILPFLVKLTQ